MALRQNLVSDATLLIGASQRHFEDMGLQRERFQVELRSRELERLRETMDDELGPTFEEGRHLSVADAVTLAVIAPCE